MTVLLWVCNAPAILGVIALICCLVIAIMNRWLLVVIGKW